MSVDLWAERRSTPSCRSLFPVISSFSSWDVPELSTSASGKQPSAVMPHSDRLSDQSIIIILSYNIHTYIYMLSEKIIIKTWKNTGN